MFWLTYQRKNWPKNFINLHSKLMRATKSYFFYLDLPCDLAFTILTLPSLFWLCLYYSDLAFTIFWLFSEWYSVHQHRLLCQTVWCGGVWQVQQDWRLSLWPILHLEWQQYELRRSLSSQETSVRINIFQCQYVVVWAFANQIVA